jgi:hypothetical protein
MGNGIVAMSASNRQDSDIWVGWSICSNLPTRRNCESTFCPVIARSDSDEAIPARMKGELPRGAYPEPFPNCHPERSEGSQGKGQDSSVASLPQNDTERRAQNDSGKGLAMTRRVLLNVLTVQSITFLLNSLDVCTLSP